MENKNKKITKQLFALALVLVVLLGGTYAWLTLQVNGEKTNVLKAGTLSLVLDDTTSGGIKLEKAVPISDEKGKTGTEYTFTLQNKGTKAASYTIYLDDVALETNETRMDDSKVKYQLTKNSNETVALLSTLSDKALDSGTIDGSTTNTYSLRVWIDSAAETEVMGTILSKELRVEATQVGAKTTTTAMCKRATTLQTEQCIQTDSTYYCSGAGFSGKTIVYGSLGTEGILTSGDAFDCDVNGDGVYDPDTERFYYVTDVDSATAVLIYYNNVSNGNPSSTATYAYYEGVDENWHGPITAIKQLPTTKQWKNVNLKNSIRSIQSENGGNTTTGGTLPDSFSYEGYAARLLTNEELNRACNIKMGSWVIGELDSCNYLMQNTKYSNPSNAAWGTWLENPREVNSDRAGMIDSFNRFGGNNTVSNSSDLGVRPAIEVAKTNIDY